VRTLSGRTWLTVFALSVLVLAAGAFARLDRTRPAGSPPGFALVAGIRNPTQAAEKTLRLELRSEHLNFQDVTCIENGRHYHGLPIIRCNVNFGDPHVQAYCSVISAGRLVTNYQNPSIPCGPDLAGSRPLLFPTSA
jgi:hypothetical protein